MKTKLRLLLFTVFSSLLLNSCAGDNEVNHGTSTGNYLPLALNNQWIYIDQNNQEQSMKLINKENINNKPFFLIQLIPEESNSEYTTKNYYAKVGATYYTRSKVEYTNPGITVTPLEGIILRDDYEVNQTWTQNSKLTIKVSGYGSQTVPVALIGKITDKNISLSVKGVTYNNVIKSNVKITINDQVVESNYWFAKDIGVIKMQTYQQGNLLSDSELTSYTVN